MFQAFASSACTVDPLSMALRTIGTASDFPADNPCPRIAATLAGDNHNLLLAVFAALLPAIGLAVLGANAGAEICAVNLDLAGQLASGRDLRAHCLAQLVQEHESRLRIDVHVAAHLQSRRAFDAVAEQRDHGEVVADRQLAAVEDRAAGDAELLAACRAFPAHRSFGQRVDLDAPQPGQYGSPSLAANRTLWNTAKASSSDSRRT